MPTITYTEELVTHACWCGINHAIPRNLDRQAREKGTAVYCPLGHKWIIGETENDRLQKRLAALEGNLKYERERLEREQRSHAATKGQLTKERKRTAAGMCPCCQRSFVQLARHMKNQHPDFAPTDNNEAER